MPFPNAKITKRTDKKAAEVWIANRLNGVSQAVIAEKYGIGSRAICHWIEYVEYNPELLKKAENRNIDDLSDDPANPEYLPVVKPKNSKRKKGGKGKAKKTTFYRRLKELEKETPAVKTRRSNQEKIKTLEADAKFYKWWAQGERDGFIDRLLREIQDN